MFETAIQTFTSPVVLFFVLGLFAAFVRSDLAIPEGIAKGMSLYLMAAIGLKGGVAVANSGINATVISALGAGLVAGFSAPVFCLRGAQDVRTPRPDQFRRSCGPLRFD